MDNISPKNMTPAGMGVEQASASTSSTTTPSDVNAACPLLKVPAEIKNAVFELVVPTNTAVFLRAASNNGVVHFNPKSPAVAAVCRQLRADAPLALYYGTNTFVVTDSLIKSGAAAAFFQCRKPAIRYMRRVRVCNTITNKAKYGHNAIWTYQFDIVRAESGMVEVVNTKLRCPDLDRLVGNEGLCFCMIREVLSSGDTLLDGVRKYVELAEKPWRFPGYRHCRGIHCVVCGKARFM